MPTVMARGRMFIRATVWSGCRSSSETRIAGGQWWVPSQKTEFIQVCHRRGAEVARRQSPDQVEMSPTKRAPGWSWRRLGRMLTRQAFRMASRPAGSWVAAKWATATSIGMSLTRLGRGATTVASEMWWPVVARVCSTRSQARGRRCSVRGSAWGKRSGQSQEARVLRCWARDRRARSASSEGEASRKP